MACRNISIKDEIINKNEPLFHQSHNLLATYRTPTMRSTSLFDEETANGINLFNLNQIILESQCCVSPTTKKTHKEKKTIHIIKTSYKKIMKKPKTLEELKEIDDNEIINLLCNFPGVLNLWYSLPNKDRLYLWEGKDSEFRFKIYHKSVIWFPLFY